ncbi:uncharacterized protein TNCV_783701 [Trichonephila clavipes]|nr:uncharacterized protein TNCV_783701 [Trichonephila clavipes]
MDTVDFLHQENPPTWFGVEPANLGEQGQRQTIYATQPVCINCTTLHTSDITEALIFSVTPLFPTLRPNGIVVSDADCSAVGTEFESRRRHLGKTLKETYAMLVCIHEYQALSMKCLLQWLARFQEDGEKVSDKTHSERPATSVSDESIEKVRKLTVRMIADELQINRESVRQIIFPYLGMRKTWGIRRFLAKKGVGQIEHPPYSPHLNPPDFFLFPRLKFALKGKRFDDIPDIQRNVTKLLNSIPKEDFLKSFQDMYSGSQRGCVTVESLEAQMSSHVSTVYEFGEGVGVCPPQGSSSSLDLGHSNAVRRSSTIRDNGHRLMSRLVRSHWCSMGFRFGEFACRPWKDVKSSQALKSSQCDTWLGIALPEYSVGCTHQQE